MQSQSRKSAQGLISQSSCITAAGVYRCSWQQRSESWMMVCNPTYEAGTSTTHHSRFYFVFSVILYLGSSTGFSALAILTYTHQSLA